MPNIYDEDGNLNISNQNRRPVSNTPRTTRPSPQSGQVRHRPINNSVRPNGAINKVPNQQTKRPMAKRKKKNNNTIIYVVAIVVLILVLAIAAFAIVPKLSNNNSNVVGGDTGTETTASLKDNDTTTDTTAQTTDAETTSQKVDDTTETTQETTTEAETEKEPTGIGDKTSKGYAITRENGAYFVNYNGTKILVANKSFDLSPDYAPGDLTSTTAAAFKRLQAGAAEDGINIFLASGYRSYTYQQSVYQKWVNKYGQEQADRISARPGYSEHQTGLAIDVNQLDESFGETAAGKWLAAHAHEYGFIIRYTKQGESKTGYAYEPWHIRYLGDVAEEVYKSGLTLEEFLGITSKYAD